jgi:hypothetical protein
MTGARAAGVGRAGWRALPFLAALLPGTLALSSAAACHGQLRFDEHGLDARASDRPAERPPAADGLCGDRPCSFEGQGCSPTQPNCRFECDERRTCSGGCGLSCTGACETDSTCEVTAGDSANLRCGLRARCTFTVGAASTVACNDGSHCDVRCLGRCGLTCATGAQCTLACGATAPLRAVTGSPSCTGREAVAKVTGG